MTHLLVPPEFLEQAAQFRDPAVVIDVTFEGVEIPARMRASARDGKIFLQLNGEIADHLRFDPDGYWFELTGISERVHIPGGAIAGVIDRATGGMITMHPELLKEAN